MEEKRVYREIKGALFAVVIAFSVLSMALASPASGSPMVKGDELISKPSIRSSYRLS